MDFKGNSFTQIMHLYVLNELHKMRVNCQILVNSISLEKNVEIEKNGKKVCGSFDFLVNSNGKLLGFEVLTRPTQGKMREKLAYAKNVDEFIFVLPFDSLGFYKKPKTKIFHKQAKLNFFEKEFRNPKIRVWLFDIRTGKFEKEQFNQLFNVNESS